MTMEIAESTAIKTLGLTMSRESSSNLKKYRETITGTVSASPESI